MEKKNSKFDPPGTESCQRITHSRDQNEKYIRNGQVSNQKIIPNQNHQVWTVEGASASSREIPYQMPAI
jgi:hypothetical protein